MKSELQYQLFVSYYSGAVAIDMFKNERAVGYQLWGPREGE